MLFYALLLFSAENLQSVQVCQTYVLQTIEALELFVLELPIYVESFKIDCRVYCNNFEKFFEVYKQLYDVKNAKKTTIHRCFLLQNYIPCITKSKKWT